MAERFTDKTEYMASLRDKNRIESIKARVDINDPKVAGELYNRLKEKPAYFETEVGRKFMQSLFVTYKGAKRLSMPAPKLGEDAAPADVRKSAPGVPGSRKAPGMTTGNVSAPDRKNVFSSITAKLSGETPKKIEKPAAKASKITIVEGAENLKVKYNRSIFMDNESLDALDVLTNTKREYNDFWDGESDMAEDYEPAPDPAKRRKRMKALLIATAGVAAVFLAIFLGKEISDRIENYNSKQKLAELQNIVSRNSGGKRSLEEVTHAHAAEPTKAQENGEGTDTGRTGSESGGALQGSEGNETQPEPTQAAAPVILPEYAELYNRNPDLVGWMNIPGTIINYPVMQTKDDMEYYLYRDFDRGNDKNGLPFVDARSDVFEPTANVLIYGHCMSSGAMFASLLNYKDKAYFDAHPVIYFDTIYEHAEYEIIACFQSRVAYVGENVFRYYSFIDTDSEAEFNDFVTNIKAMSYYETGETAEFGDSLITLSTCDKEITNGRMVIVARKAK